MTGSALFRRHFQVCYAVDNAKSAMKTLGEQYGVTRWQEIDHGAQGAESAARLICTAWIGDFMLELIEPNPAVQSIYSKWLENTSQPFRFHHLGFLIDSTEQMEAAKRRLSDNGFPIVVEGSFGEALDFAYADTTAGLGHYYELIHLKPEGKIFFDNIPQN